MKVKKVMTKDVGYCEADDKLIKAVGIMWQKDCGIIPVVDKNRKVIGMVTDRDICIALTTRNRLASDVLADSVLSGKVISCRLNDDVKIALRKMEKNQLKRLPVVNKKGELAGLISLGDILLGANKKSDKKRVVRTLKAIVKPSPILLKEIKN